MIGKIDSLCSYSMETKPRTVLYIPLQFYFCRNPGLALPLIALQYHEVKINMELRPIELLWISGAEDGRLRSEEHTSELPVTLESRMPSSA